MNTCNNLSLNIYEDVLIMPLRGTMDKFESGVFKNGKCIESSLMVRCKPSKIEKSQIRIDTTCFFGGYFFGHIGHFILESLSRLWAYDFNSLYPIIFVTPDENLQQWQIDILKLLNVSNKVYIIKQPTKLYKLIIPSVASSSVECINEKQLEVLSVYNAKQRPGFKIWLSRSNWPVGKVYQEKIIEDELKRNGWSIIHPESLSIIQQISVLSKAETIAGFGGSAFYLLLFCNNLNTNIKLFSRRNSFQKVMIDCLKRKCTKLETYIPKAQFVEGFGASENYSIEARDILDKLI